MAASEAETVPDAAARLDLALDGGLLARGDNVISAENDSNDSKITL